MSGYSVFIPRMFSNIKENRIRRVFHDLKIGNVGHVDLVSKTGGKGDTYNMAFVHFDIIYNTEQATTFRQDVENPDKKAKVVYDEPWFWLVLPFEQKDKKVANATTTTTQTTNLVTPPPMPMMYPTIEDHQMASHGMVSMYVMTPQGPIIQWGYPHYIPQNISNTTTYPNSNDSKKSTNSLKLVPRQVAYGNIYDIQRSHPRKRMRMDGPRIESREETYAHENSAIITENELETNLEMEMEMERQMDYHNQMEMYKNMEQIEN